MVTARADSVSTLAAQPNAFDTAELNQCIGNPSVLTCGKTAQCYTGSPDPALGNYQYVGCCSYGTKCSARNTCYDLTAIPSSSCDSIAGGCISCSNPAAPYCAATSNLAASQVYMYCDVSRVIVTTAFNNPVTYGSMAALPGPTPSNVPTSPATSVPTFTPSTPTANASPEKTGIRSTGLVIGLSTGLGIFAIIVVGFIVNCIRRRYNAHNPSPPSTGSFGTQNWTDQSQTPPIGGPIGVFGGTQPVHDHSTAGHGTDGDLESPHISELDGSPSQREPRSGEMSPVMRPGHDSVVYELAAHSAPGIYPAPPRDPDYIPYVPQSVHAEGQSAVKGADGSGEPSPPLATGISSEGSFSGRLSEPYLSAEDAMSYGYRDST